MSFFKSFYTLACTWHWLYLSLNWILYWDLFALPLFIFLMRKGLHIGLITNAFRYLPFGKALNLVSLEGCFSVLDLGDLLLYLQYSKAQERTFPLQPKTGKIQNMIRNKCPSPVGRASKPPLLQKKTEVLPPMGSNHQCSLQSNPCSRSQSLVDPQVLVLPHLIIEVPLQGLHLNINSHLMAILL